MSIRILIIACLLPLGVASCVDVPERSFEEKMEEYRRLERMRQQHRFEKAIERAIERSKR